MQPTRRDILAALIGAPIALTACRRPPDAPPLQGELVGANAQLGHRLLGGLESPPPPDRWKEVGVLIIGAGAAGLSAAWRLARAGYHDFQVLEVEAEIGGTARSGRNAVSAYPWGAHYVPVPQAHNPAIRILLEEIGVIQGYSPEGIPQIDERHLVREPEERVFRNGYWSKGLLPTIGAVQEDLQQIHRFEAEMDRWAGWRDARGRRAFIIPTALASDAPEVQALDHISMASWMKQQGFTSRLLTWYVNYACRDDFGTRLDTTSAWAGIFYFTARKAAPGEASAPFLTWPEGLGRLIAHLRKSALGRIRTGVLTTNLVPHAGGPGEGGVDAWIYDQASQQVEGYRAQRVIVTTPMCITRHIVQPFREQPPPHLQAFTYSPWLVTNLTLKTRPPEVGFPFAWDNVLFDSPSLGYVSATHQSLRDFGPTVWTWYLPLCGPDPSAERRRLLAMDWGQCADATLDDLRQVYPHLEAHVTRVDVMRWGHAMVRPTPGFIWGGARQQAQRPHRGIHFANTDLSGVALVEEANDHGIRAAEEVLAELGQPVPTIRV